MKKNYKFVIFDMDGLMFNTERRYCEETIKIAKNNNVEINESVLYSAIGSSYFDMDNFFVHGIPKDADVTAMFENVVDNSVDDMCANGVPKKPGLDELMDFLYKKGIKMAVATSTPLKRSGRLLESAGVMPLLEFVLTGEEVEKGKPAPDIFIKTCEKAGYTREDSLVLEDSINGGEAAKAAGVDYIIVPDINQPTEKVSKSALAVVDSLFDVIDIISK